MRNFLVTDLGFLEDQKFFVVVIVVFNIFGCSGSLLLHTGFL